MVLYILSLVIDAANSTCPLSTTGETRLIPNDKQDNANLNLSVPTMFDSQTTYDIMME